VKDVNGDTFVRNTFDELMEDVLYELLYDPQFVCSPRGSEVKELIVPRLVLTNPRNRLLTSERRNANYGFAVGEFLWYWRGSNSLEEMTYYNKRMPNFSDDGKTLNSAYGHIMKGKGNGEFGINQWKFAIETLHNDTDSRRAILQIHHPEHQSMAYRVGSKDVPCTLSLQFFIRDNELHLHTNMRSNDVMWGLTYDLFSFTLFQECMLLDLKRHWPEAFKDLELGRYYHTAGSLHLYERHYKMAEKMYEEYTIRLDKWARNWSSSSPYFTEPMIPIDDINELERLCISEAALRTGDIDEIDVGSFFGAVGWMAEQLNAHRRKRDEEQDKR